MLPEYDEALKAVNQAEIDKNAIDNKVNARLTTLKNAKEEKENADIAVNEKNSILSVKKQITEEKQTIKEVAQKEVNDLLTLLENVETKENELTNLEAKQSNLEEEINETKDNNVSLTSLITNTENAIPPVEARHAQILEAQNVWDSVLNGSDEILNTEDPALKLISEYTEEFKVARTVEEETKANYLEIKSVAEKKRAVYFETKKEYEEAKLQREKIENDITAYLESLKKEEIIEMQIKGENTGVETNTIIYAGGMILAGAACLELLIKSRKNKV